MKQPVDLPPDIDGYRYRRGIAAGGFADVFLYEQQQPKRPVAIKVLRQEHVSPDSLRNFEIEANTMAEVSDHSNIVSIFRAGAAPDGRPYIVMEYCDGERFDVRSRGGHMPIHLVLETGIQIAGAIETAHRANIFHRDLKPENILTNRKKLPGLTDFGISGVRRKDAVQGAAGYTPQFAPPEVIRNPLVESTAAIDIYSLGATLFYFLAGNAPYFVHGGDNGREAIEARTKAGPVPPVLREDVPPLLRNLIRNALSHEPGDRPASAFAFAQALQDVQQELHLPQTDIEVFEVAPLPEDFIPEPPRPSGGVGAETSGVHERSTMGPRTGSRLPDPAPPSDVPPDDHATVAGAVSAPAPDQSTVAGPVPSPLPPPADPNATSAAGRSAPPTAWSSPAAPPVSAPAPPPAAVAPPPVPPAVVVEAHPGAPAPVAHEAESGDGTRRSGLPPAAIAGLVLVLLAIVAAVVLGGGIIGGSGDTTTTVEVTDPPNLVNAVAAPPTEVAVARVDGVPTATWTVAGSEDAEAATAFRITVLADTDGALEPVDLGEGRAYFDVPAADRSAPLPVDPDAAVTTYCVRVATVAGDQISDAAPPTAACG